jgi:membrane protease YdiL (CAAX protease family)
METKRNRSLLARIGAAEAPPPWSLATVVLTIVAAFLLFVAGTLLAFAWLEGQPYAAIAGWLVGGLLTILFVAQSRRHPEDRAALRLGPPKTPLVFIMLIGLGFAIAIDILSLAVTGQFLPAPELIGISLSGGGIATWVVVLAFMIIVKPVAEELVFRGVALPALRAALSPWLGLLITAGLHAGFHLLLYPPNYAIADGFTPIWYGFAVPLLAALVIGAVRAVTGSTRAAIAAHAAFGLFAVAKLATLGGA